MTQAEYKAAKRGGWWGRLWRHWPFISWLLLAAVCLALYARSTQYGIVTGTAQAVHHDVAPLELARVKQLFIQVGSHVTKGQVVAQMDTLLVDTQLAEAEANLATARNNMAASQGQMLNLVRAVDDEILRAEQVLEQTKTQRESATAKLVQLQAIQAERTKLFQSHLIPETQVDALRPEIAGLEKEVAAYPAQLTLAERTLAQQRKHREQLESALHLGPGENVLKAVAEKAAAETQRLEIVVELRRREKDAYTLRSEADGVVSDIQLQPGVVAKAGQTVLTVSARGNLIIGYLPEFRLGRLKPGDRGFAFRVGNPAVPVEVVEVVPEVTSLPQPVSPISAPLGTVLRSQKVVFRTDQMAEITPGEKVEIRMGSELWVKARRALASLGL